MKSVPGDNASGITLAITSIILAAIVFFGMRDKIGISKTASWSIFIGLIIFLFLSFFGYVPSVGGGWCTDSDGYTTRWKNGKCHSNRS